MIRQPVSSTDIRSIGYDPESQTLEVEFHSGGVYQYFGVPASVYSGLMSASSHGKYFHRHVKNVYRYVKSH
ncbi:MAG: KTSC domain-containing protein [Anaerolineae bacterium]|nr:KTSC domain-containing protein [Anaerolineae bacterium]